MSVVAEHLARHSAPLFAHPLRAVETRAVGHGGSLTFESWVETGPPGLSNEGEAADTPTAFALRKYLRGKPWVAPSQPICFLTDLHADREAFWRSLMIAGMVAPEGVDNPFDLGSIPDSAFELSPFGEQTHFMIGGDLFDKGPANLPLLDAISHFRKRGVRFTLIAGNHDVRTRLGIRFARATDPRLAHLFVRMGKKTMTLFKEVFEAHLAGGDRGERLSDDSVREQLFPSESWFEEFPRMAAGTVPPARIEKELLRVREKMAELEARCHAFGMSLGDLHATLERCERLFLEPDGEYAWVFQDMEIAHREGSMLFAHAGIDDVAAGWMRQEGLGHVRRRFSQTLEEDPFELYNGPLGNMFRTKYRDLDLPLSEAGLEALHGMGIYAIVHGHRNVFLGQHMNFRRGMLNFACDACVDINTREVESLPGEGSAATILATDGTIYGLSADHPAVKVFDPVDYGGWVTSA
ncbi:MAG: metallophosphoesterase family protein [bacterium]